MSAIQGVQDALSGILDLSLNYGLVAASVYYVTLTTCMEGGSYLGASLNIAFLCLLLGLALAPNPNFMPGSSSVVGLLSHVGAKSLAVFFFGVGHSLLKQDPLDTIFLREASTICMAACLALILPVIRLEAMDADQVAMCDNALDTSDTMTAADPSIEEGDTPISSAGYWKKLSYYAVPWLLVLAYVGSIVSQATTHTSADGTLNEPMMVNDSIFVNDTIIISDTWPLPPGMPAKANLTIPSISVPTPDFITTLGTPCQVTPTPAPPSPIAKSTWTPAAMSTPMPTPEPTPTALPEVKQEPQPEAVAAPQDVSGAFKLMVDLLTSEAKSILSPPVKSAMSWYLSLRVEDQFAAAALTLVLACLLFSLLVAGVAVISALYILPLTCLLSTGLFFCLRQYEFTHGLSLIICVMACVVSILALLTAAFLAQLLKYVKLLRGHAAELPKIWNNLTEAERKADGLIKTSQESTAGTNRMFVMLSGLLQILYLRIEILAKRLTALQSRRSDFARRIKSIEDLIRQLEASQADPEDIKKLRREMEDIKTQLRNLKDTAACDETLKKVEDKLQKQLGELSVKVTNLFNSLELLPARMDQLEAEMRAEFDRAAEDNKTRDERLDNFENQNQSTKQQMETLATKDELYQVINNFAILDNNAKRHRAETSRQYEDVMKVVMEQVTQAMLEFWTSEKFFDLVRVAVINPTRYTIMEMQAKSNGNPPDLPPESKPKAPPSPTGNTKDDHDSSGVSTESSAHGSEAPCSSSSDPPDGSSASNNPVGDTGDVGNNGETNRRGRLPAGVRKRRIKERIALNGMPITGGDVIDKTGNKLAHVTLLTGITGDLSQVGNTVSCDKQGFIRDASGKPIASLWLPDETEYVRQLPKEVERSVQDGAEDDAS